MKPIIQVENLSKQYRIGAREAAYSTFRESIGGALKAPFQRFSRNSNNDEHTLWALKDVSFEVQPGEVVGIIGRNGAGKSTLLKVLSRITEPTQGRVKLYGRVASLLEVGTGFHPELTGRENIYLNGAILGMKRREIERKFDEIVTFAELEMFIDTPVKRYSSGMYMRLAFAVAAHLESEVLIIDEVLAVGDVDFQKKCFGKVGEISKGEGRTVLLVSHNLIAIRNFCESSILLDQGKVMCFEETSNVIRAYSSKRMYATRFNLENIPRTRGEKSILVRSVELDSPEYYPYSQLEISVRLKNNIPSRKIRSINIAVFIFDGFHNVIYQMSTAFDENANIEFSEKMQYKFIIEKINLNAGAYSLGIWLQGNGREQDYTEDTVHFEVKSGNIYGATSPLIVSVVQKEFIFRCAGSVGA